MYFSWKFSSNLKKLLQMNINNEYEISRSVEEINIIKIVKKNYILSVSTLIVSLVSALIPIGTQKYIFIYISCFTNCFLVFLGFTFNQKWFNMVFPRFITFFTEKMFAHGLCLKVIFSVETCNEWIELDERKVKHVMKVATLDEEETMSR